MKKLSIGLLAMLLSTPLFCQSDSLKVIGIVKWRLERLLDVYHYDLPKAEQSIVDLNSTVRGFKIALEASGKLVEIRTLERDLLLAINQKSDSIAKNSEVIFKEGIKAERKKGWKKLAVGAVLGFVLAAVFL